MRSSDPVAVELNVDAALLLQSLIGIEGYPDVLALLPNVFDFQDEARVQAVIGRRLTETGIIDGGRVHPRIAYWLRCLHRPDMELAARILDLDLDVRAADRRPRAMLRMSLVRSGDTHVLATRCNDDLVIQQLDTGSQPLRTAAAVLATALGPAEPLPFDSVTAPLDRLSDLPDDPPDEIRHAWRKFGASNRTATVLATVTSVVQRSADITMIEHQDGRSVETPTGASIFDTPAGRIVAMPSRGIDEQLWCTFTSGDSAALEAAVTALVQLLPARSWTPPSDRG